MEFLQNLSRKQAVIISAVVLTLAAAIAVTFYILGRSQHTEEEEVVEIEQEQVVREPLTEDELNEIIQQNSGPRDVPEEQKAIKSDELLRIIQENSGN